MSPRSLCVLMPGPTFSARWVAEWSGLLLNLCRQFHTRLAWSQGNNIYLTRENTLKLAMGGDAEPPEFLLWIDSDNPPNVEGFEMLIGALDASPEVSIVGAWYRFFNPDSKEVHIAAGFNDRTSHHNLTEAEVLDSDRLIEVDFIGFGYCLMRSKVIQDIGLEKCFEPLVLKEPNHNGRTWATDDDGFCYRARTHGHRIFVHPAVQVQHEKVLNVPATFQNCGEIPIFKET